MPDFYMDAPFPRRWPEGKGHEIRPVMGTERIGPKDGEPGWAMGTRTGDHGGWKATVTGRGAMPCFPAPPKRNQAGTRLRTRLIPS